MSTSTIQLIFGECNCGSIKISIPKPESSVLCHCTRCRKSGGGMYSTLFLIDPKDLDIVKGHDQIKTYVANGESGYPVTRHFCGHCGSPIYSVTATPNPIYIKGGLFNVGDIPPVSAELFTRNLEKWKTKQPNSAAFEGNPPA